MPKIVDTIFYNGTEVKIARLGMTPLWDELRHILTGFQLLVKEEKDQNGGAAVRTFIDSAFDQAGGWEKKQTGDIDRKKCLRIGETTSVCIGVEIQFSGRSDLSIIDVDHLRKQLTSGYIDVGVMVVPSDHLSIVLTDRGPNLASAKQAVQRSRADDLSLAILALEHDGSGPGLPKKKTKS